VNSAYGEDSSGRPGSETNGFVPAGPVTGIQRLPGGVVCRHVEIISDFSNLSSVFSDYCVHCFEQQPVAALPRRCIAHRMSRPSRKFRFLAK
jgi:hypothetical protein